MLEAVGSSFFFGGYDFYTCKFLLFLIDLKWKQLDMNYFKLLKEENIYIYRWLAVFNRLYLGKFNYSDYSPNRGYYYEQYNYVNKLQIVSIWKQRQGLPAVACKGEAICNDQLVNFFKDQEHKNCICSVVWINTFLV